MRCLITLMTSLFLLIACSDRKDTAPASTALGTEVTAPRGSSASTTVETAATAATPSPTKAATGDVVMLAEPEEGVTIAQSPITLSGSLRSFENHALLRLLAADGTLIAQKPIVARGEAGAVNPFSETLYITRDPGSSLTLELSTHSAKDGAVTGQVRRRVAVADTRIRPTLHYAAPDGNDCRRTAVVETLLLPSQSAARQLVEVLIADPRAVLRPDDRLFPTGAHVRGITRRGDLLIVDFDESMRNVGGSCRAAALRSEIERTLRGIEEVSKVEIRAGGSASLALQP